MNVKDFVSVLGNPLGDDYSVFDLLEETPDFSGENPVLLLHPTGLSFGRAVSSALSVRKAETPVGVCLSKKRRPRRRAYGAATSRFRLRRTAAADALWSLIFQFGSDLFEIYLNLGSSKAAAASEGTK